MSNITKEQNANLIKTVATLVNVFKKNENVECIYLMPFKIDGNNIYRLVIVYDSERITLAKKKQSIRYCNAKIKEKLDTKKIGGELCIIAECSSKYEERALNPSRVNKVQSLLSSRILYTKEGYGRKYYRVAHQFDRHNTLKRYPEYFRISIPKEDKKKMKKMAYVVSK